MKTKFGYEVVEIIGKTVDNHGGGEKYEDGKYYYHIGFTDGTALRFCSETPIKIVDEEGNETGERL